ARSGCSSCRAGTPRPPSAEDLAGKTGRLSAARLLAGAPGASPSFFRSPPVGCAVRTSPLHGAHGAPYRNAAMSPLLLLPLALLPLASHAHADDEGATVINGCR